MPAELENLPSRNRWPGIAPRPPDLGSHGEAGGFAPGAHQVPAKITPRLKIAGNENSLAADKMGALRIGSCATGPRGKPKPGQGPIEARPTPEVWSPFFRSFLTTKPNYRRNYFGYPRINATA